MKIAVLGSGNGGCAIAFDWAQHGHQVGLFALEEFPGEVAAVAEAGGLTSSGALTGFAPVDYAGHDAERAVAGADLVLVVGPAYSTEPLARAVAPYLQPDQAVVVCPTSCLGSVAFKQAAGLGLTDERPLVGETSTLPYAVRITGLATIRVYLKLRAGQSVAATPTAGTARLQELLSEVYPDMAAAGSIFDTTLQNGNPVIHPAVSLANAALIERTGGDFHFYEDGVTEAVGRLIRAVDQERIAIGRALGHEIATEPAMGVRQGYMVEENYSTGYSRAPGFAGIKAQDALDNRYFTEDVGYTLVCFADLAARIGVPTPSIDAVITIVSIMLDRDFRTEGARTLATLGLADYDRDALTRL